MSSRSKTSSGVSAQYGGCFLQASKHWGKMIPLQSPELIPPARLNSQLQNGAKSVLRASYRKVHLEKQPAHKSLQHQREGWSINLQKHIINN